MSYQVAGQRVLAGQGFLVAEDQSLVAGVEVDLVQAHLGPQVDAAGRHEAQGPVDLAGDGLVALALPAGGDELLVPHVDLAQVGETTLGEGAHQVERGGRLVVGGDQTAGVRATGLERRGVVVDDVAAEGGEPLAADYLVRRRAGLGELPGDAAHLHHRDAAAVGEDHGHLQDDLELVADAVGGEVVEGLGAVTGLEQEGPALGHLGQGAAQGPGLAGEDERGQGREDLERLLEGVVVRPFRLLLGGPRTPRGGSPFVHALNRTGAPVKSKSINGQG